VSWPLVAAIFAIGALAGLGVGRVFFGTSRPAPASPPAASVAAPALPSSAAPTPERAAAPAPRRDEPAPAQVAGPSAPAPSSGAGATPPADPAPAVRAPSPARNRAASAPARGQLTVRSTPAGARVEVNGRARGQTPLTVRDLRFGAVTVRVIRDGYGTEQRRVTLTASRASQAIDVPLSRRAATAGSVPAAVPARTSGSGQFVGTVVVETRPAGARVFIDGREVGTSPLAVPGVAAGSHVVRFELPGYKRWSASVSVVAGGRNRVAASLEEEAR
jgi:hypothetical protein